MSGRHKFSKLRERIESDPVRRERMEKKSRADDVLLALHELRDTSGATQAEIAQGLGVSQPYVAKLERRGDMSLTTLASYLAVLGGHLEVRAVFPDHPEDNVALKLPADDYPRTSQATGGVSVTGVTVDTAQDTVVVAEVAVEEVEDSDTTAHTT